MAEEGYLVFTNHIVTAIKNDGSKLTVKVLAQFTIKNDRLAACDELTHLTAGKNEDRDFESRR